MSDDPVHNHPDMAWDMAWQTIDTAPKDGTWILCYSPKAAEFERPDRTYCVVSGNMNRISQAQLDEWRREAEQGQYFPSDIVISMVRELELLKTGHQVMNNIVAIVKCATGNGSIGLEWSETATFGIDEPLVSIVNWAEKMGWRSQNGGELILTIPTERKS